MPHSELAERVPETGVVSFAPDKGAPNSCFQA